MIALAPGPPGKVTPGAATAPGSGVTHVPGHGCYPCTRTGPPCPPPLRRLAFQNAHRVGRGPAGGTTMTDRIFSLLLLALLLGGVSTRATEANAKNPALSRAPSPILEPLRVAPGLASCGALNATHDGTGWTLNCAGSCNAGNCEPRSSGGGAGAYLYCGCEGGAPPTCCFTTLVSVGTTRVPGRNGWCWPVAPGCPHGSCHLHNAGSSPPTRVGQCPCDLPEPEPVPDED